MDRDTGRMMQATLEGRTYSIPELWMAGYCRGGATIPEAVVWWAYQTELGELEGPQGPRGPSELEEAESCPTI